MCLTEKPLTLTALATVSSQTHTASCLSLISSTFVLVFSANSYRQALVRRNRRRPRATATDLTGPTGQPLSFSRSSNPSNPRFNLSFWGSNRQELVRQNGRQPHLCFSQNLRSTRESSHPLHMASLSFYSNPPLSSLFLSYPSSQTNKRIWPPTAHVVPPLILPHPFSQGDGWFFLVLERIVWFFFFFFLVVVVVVDDDEKGSFPLVLNGYIFLSSYGCNKFVLF